MIQSNNKQTRRHLQRPKLIPPIRRSVHPDADTPRRDGKLAIPARIDHDRPVAPAQDVGPFLARMVPADEHAFL
jgi:hypothetical protein